MVEKKTEKKVTKVAKVAGDKPEKKTVKKAEKKAAEKATEKVDAAKVVKKRKVKVTKRPFSRYVCFMFTLCIH